MTLAEEKEDFSKRFKEAARRARVDISSPTRVAREFNLRHHGDPVSTQSVRKWLAGEALPSQDKIRTLGLWLDVSTHWLRFGEGERKEERAPLAARQEGGAYRTDHAWATRKFDQLTDVHKRMVLEMIHALLRLEGKQ